MSDPSRRCAFGNQDWLIGAAVMVIATVAAAAVVLVVGLWLLGWL